ncbi:thiosulfate sulfurtransferase GlpE [Pseudocolwellia sp. HL-MZ19]|uniref:thiosulfate sulfurtransferase GlpE n=1 Tax=unclassified Pseudocolwellia TaxID=2848178 RepID=UPI003CF082F6
MSDSTTNFKHMQISELHPTLAEKTYVVVDIRDPNSFKSGHIPGAIELTNESLSDFMREADLDAPVVVCCYHGHSSQQAAQYLISQDFTDVYSLDGGFTQWQLEHPSDVSTS